VERFVERAALLEHRVQNLVEAHRQREGVVDKVSVDGTQGFVVERDPLFHRIDTELFHALTRVVALQQTPPSEIVGHVKLKVREMVRSIFQTPLVVVLGCVDRLVPPFGKRFRLDVDVSRIEISVFITIVLFHVVGAQTDIFVGVHHR
tara:strand:- start:779 stop:1222 length:444 start_codon:yes stop_codon:yes gene_type:complete